MDDFRIDWSSKSRMRGPTEKTLGHLVRQLVCLFAPNAREIGIQYVDDRTMRKYNRQHRGKNTTTDVLSFPSFPEQGSYQHIGDIVICLPQAEKMAQKFGTSRRRQIETLLIHGFLHLCGMDHETDSGEMLAKQAELEKSLLKMDPLPIALPRGRRPGTKIKVLSDGTRKLVGGRAAAALARRDQAPKFGVATNKKGTSPVSADRVQSGRTTSSLEKPGIQMRRSIRKRRPISSRPGVIR